MALQTACDFYGADWCGFLEVDLDLGLWTPYWWHNIRPDDKTQDLLESFVHDILVYGYDLKTKIKEMCIYEKVLFEKLYYISNYQNLKCNIGFTQNNIKSE